MGVESVLAKKSCSIDYVRHIWKKTNVFRITMEKIEGSLFKALSLEKRVSIWIKSN